MKTDLFRVESSNPSFLAYLHYEREVISVRDSLFSSLHSKSDRIAAAAEKIFDKKINNINQGGIPHLFEIFPWLLRDLTNLDYVKSHEISINWLALYLYVTFLDDHLDNKSKIEPDEFIAASVLAQTSLINLFKIVDKTKYEDLFKESLIRSAEYELKDVIEQALVYDESFTKSESASGKNAILLACAGAIAASTDRESDFIINITRELLLSVQLLDDLTDFEEDLNHGNITIPLNDIARNFEQTSLPRNIIIGFMLQSKSLFKVLERIEFSLGKVIALIHKSDANISQSNPALLYFIAMHSKVSLLRQYIESIEDSFENLSSKMQNKTMTRLQAKLTEIYCHT